MILKRLSLVLLALMVLVGLALPCFAESITYEYDDLYRLIKATYSDGTVIDRLSNSLLFIGGRLSTPMVAHPFCFSRYLRESLN